MSAHGTSTQGPSAFNAIPERYAGATREVGERLRFPVDSRAALAEQLGGLEEPLTVGEHTAPARVWLMLLPAHCFPLASVENFYEKVVELAAERNPEPRTRLDTNRLQTGVNHFFAERHAAEALAEALSELLGAKVEAQRIHKAINTIVRDDRATRAIAEAWAGASDAMARSEASASP